MLYFSIKRETVTLSTSKNNKFSDSVNKILKKLRFSSYQKTFDTITFSRDFIDDLELIINHFYQVTRKRLFSSMSFEEYHKYGKD